MIIRSFNIDRFGILAGQEVEELATGLNIFLGDNEAGKSTLLAFFRAMFFGYQRSGRNTLDYLADGVSTALSGGSLKLETSKKDCFILSRRPGKRGGELVLSDESGRKLSENFLADLLGGYTEKMYDQVFCFGHNDLSSLSGMKEPQVAEALYGAAFGTGFKSPWDVNKILQDRQKKLYSPRAYTTPIYKCIKRIEEIKSELGLLGSEIEQYNGLQSERAELEEKQVALQTEFAKLSVVLGRVRSLQSAWENWSGLNLLRADLALAQHPGGEFGVESLERFDEIISARDAKRVERNKKYAQLMSLKEDARHIQEFAALNAVWPACQSLLGSKESVQKALLALPRLEAALENDNERLAGLIQGLGSDWDIGKALDFEIDLSLQNGIDLGRQSLEAAQNFVERADFEARRLAADAREHAESLVALRHSMGEAVPDKAEEDFTVALAIYSAEARVRLDECGRAVTQASALSAAAQKELADVANEAEAAEAALAHLNAEHATAQTALTNVASSSASKRKAPLFSLQTARKDTRRVPWLLLCTVLALICFYSVYQFFDVTKLGQDSWSKFISLAEWKTYLAGNWPSFCLGLVFLWGAFYWLSPKAATLGLWKPNEENASFVSPEEREAQSRVDVLLGQLRVQEKQNAGLQALLEDKKTDFMQANEEAIAAQRLWQRQTELYALSPSCSPEAALRVFDFSQGAAQAGKKARDAAAAYEEATAKLKDAQKAWADWLKAEGFSPEYSPETVRLAIQRIQQIKEQAAKISELKSEMEGLQSEISSFSARVLALCQQAEFVHGAELGENEASEKISLEQANAAGSGLNNSYLDESGLARLSLAQFEALYNAAFKAHEETLRLTTQARELDTLEADLSSLDELLAEQEERIEKLLSLGQASDAEDYRVRFTQHAEHMRLRREEERLLARLELSAQQGKTADGQSFWASREEFLQALSESSGEALDEQERQITAELASLENEVGEQQKRQGEIKALLEGLESGKKNAELQSEEAKLRDELKSLMREWSVLTLAQTFIRQARRSFEEERHGTVIREASEILAGLTGHRYKQMLFDLTGKDFKAYAVSKNGESLDSESALSQGTKEQVYLALRLAFIKQHNANKESLPLIMDDILVNFDPKRSENAANIFTAFSALNQGLFFTCHPHTADLLLGSAPSAKLFTIEAGKIQEARR